MVFDFLKKAGSDQKIAVYVPSTSNVGTPISTKAFNKRIKFFQHYFSKKFGGSTESNSVGTYVSEKGGLIKEPIAKIEVFTKRTPLKKHIKDFEKTVLNKVKDWGQESIAVEKNNVLHFATRVEALKEMI